MRADCDRVQTGCGADGASFIEQYSAYLAGVLNGSDDITDVYTDPDKTYEDHTENSFYDNLVKFLRNKEKTLDKKEKWEYDLAREESIQNGKRGYVVPPGIEVKCQGHPILYLRSDLFGFSAPNGVLKSLSASWNPQKYPYARYLYLKKGKNDWVATGDESVIKVANWVAGTRTTGGSFLWPISRHESEKKKTMLADGYEKSTIWSSDYNKWRGVGSYIQDRVDVTLLEIKHFYEHLSRDGVFHKEEYAEKYHQDILYVSELKKNDNMRIWLTHFGSFEGYISFFDLEDFVSEKYEIKNIVTGKKLTEQNCESKHTFQNLTAEQLEEMLDRLSRWIEKRSARMEKDIFT